MASTSKICDVEVCETVQADNETCSLVGCFYRDPWVTECKSAQVIAEACAQQSGLSYSCREAATTLQLFPYKVQVTQLLSPVDCEKQHRYCEWLLAEVEDDPGMLGMTSFSYEAWFHLTGYVNSEKSRIWSKEHPHTTHESPLVWIVVCRIPPWDCGVQFLRKHH
jgi:hypothetical protein